MPVDVRVRASVPTPVGPRAAAGLVAQVLRAEGVREGALSLAFVGRRRMRTLNRTWLGRDRLTDVLAFPLAAGGTFAGDVYVAPEAAARAARRYGCPVRQEVQRCVVHGVLHALGYDHPDGEARVASPMWRRQERYLARFGRR